MNWPRCLEAELQQATISRRATAKSADHGGSVEECIVDGVKMLLAGLAATEEKLAQGFLAFSNTGR